MPDGARELSSIDFESMIGGPLSAVIKAQAQSAVTSVDFIKAVGFNEDDGEMAPIMVTFRYMKPVQVGDEIQAQPYELSVPILTMLPIPFIRIEETRIDFNAKITSVLETSVKTDTGVGGELTAKAGWGWGSAQLKVNFSYQKSTASAEKIERTYSMAVHVRAVQDELPPGTERLLSILENAIEESPAEPAEGV